MRHLWLTEGQVEEAVTSQSNAEAGWRPRRLPFLDIGGCLLSHLKIRTSLTIIGGAISGHRGEVPAARPVPDLCGLLGDSANLLFQNGFAGSVPL
jgi:hypothetical protein